MIMEEIQLLENGVRNQVQSKDRSFHNWYQFVLGFPPHLVRHYVAKFGIHDESIVLDPFCGTGTTNVECLKLGIENIGVEANPMAFFASKVKTDWNVPAEALRKNLQTVISCAAHSLEHFGIPENVSLFTAKRNGKSLRTEPKLSEDQLAVLPKDFISPKPLRRILILKGSIETVEEDSVRDILLLALANLIVNCAGNVAFGPEVYAATPKKDAHVLDAFNRIVEGMINDLGQVDETPQPSHILLGDSRNLDPCLIPFSKRIDAVITSPPYPNEKDYTRSTRLESVLLGLISGKKQLRALKEQLLRSNSRNIFVADNDKDHIKDFKSISRIADEIEAKRISLKKTSGFEKQYHKIVRHYFGGMYRHLQSLKPFLAPDARLAYVVGDQMSFFRIHIPTAKILGEIAESIGYDIEGIELWRSRLATATKMQIEENVLVLRNS
jgi:DNA modification methylase